MTANEQNPLDLFLPAAGPFSVSPGEKSPFLEAKLRMLRSYHSDRCEGYAAMVRDWDGQIRSPRTFLEDYPYIPVSIFKQYELRSSNDELAVVQSSATTSAAASKIFVDKESRKRQARSASMILSDFIGGHRRPYLVFDDEETVRGTQAFSARGAAILSLAPLASEFHFVMRNGPEGLTLDEAALLRALDRIGDRSFMSYGFTYILYLAHRALDGKQLPPINPDSHFLHSGGWKKLTDLAVDKATFNSAVAAPWGLDPARVIDFYGLVEQIGIPYPDCSAGYKHVPYWADIVIRRADSLEAAGIGETGLIQLISALPLAGPNHSVLTEDLGRIVHADGCPCGRAGAAFEFMGRAPKAELRGCSDVARR